MANKRRGDHLKERPERNIKPTLFRLGKIATSLVILAGIAGGIYSRVNRKIPPTPIPKNYVDTNCDNNQAVDQYAGSNKQINESVCQLANAVGKETVQLYLHHPALFGRPDDSGGIFAFFIANSKIGSNSDVEFGTSTNGGPPIYSKIEFANVDNTGLGIEGAITITPLPISLQAQGSSPAQSGIFWDLSTEGQYHKNGVPIPANFDTFQPTESLSKVLREVFELSVLMKADNAVNLPAPSTSVEPITI